MPPTIARARSTVCARPTRVPIALALALTSSLVASPARAQCPAPGAPSLRAYQASQTSVELVVADSAVAGADHWEVTRTNSGGSPIAILPASIPASTPSVVDEGQGLEFGASYTYTLTVQDAAGGRTSSTASVIDVGTTPPLALGSSLTLADLFGVDPSTGQRINWWLGGFPSPIGRLYAKYLGTARAPASNASLPCASVAVQVAGTSTPAALYADRWGKLARQNPLVADRHGRFEFYADNGTYDIVVTAGSTTYTQTAVAVSDPRAAGSAHAQNGDAALTVTTGEQPATAPDGGVYLKFTRPHSSDGNDRPIPYRLIGNQAETAWGLTFNLGVDEAIGATTLDDATAPAFFLRVDRPTAALEFGLDPGYGAVDGGPWLARQPVLETLLHAGPDRVHVKSWLGAVGIAATAAEPGLQAGDVVILRKNGTVRRAYRDRLANPFSILGVDEPSGVSQRRSRVYLAIAGRSFVRVLGSMSVNDPLVATVGGVARAAPGETDARYVVGYARVAAGAAGVVSDMVANAW